MRAAVVAAAAGVAALGKAAVPVEAADPGAPWRRLIGEATRAATTSSTRTATTTAAECQPARHLMDTFTREAFPASLGSCALVGSGGALKGRGIGGEINAHDTFVCASAVRVNRVPSEPYYSDLGSKTNVFYSNSATDTYPSGELGVWITKIREGNSIGEKMYCPFQRNASSGNCPFEHLVVARSTKYGSDRRGSRLAIRSTCRSGSQITCNLLSMYRILRWRWRHSTGIPPRCRATTPPAA
ncbi:unnamed protein product [Prorocentrum cordatum]|uniref:Uncharacterized protein n=1 Tax=Prorocentrum cordatum TaxID=2364126 RepID=A0ABN9P8S1_9DINO|nr:unnamed protein product [Polarella glacialis]